MAANPKGTTLGLVDANAWAYAPVDCTPSSPASAVLNVHLAAGNYTMIIGGYDSAVGGDLAYSATISAAPVPLPGALWLMGSALAAMSSGLVRRKDRSTRASCPVA